MSSQFKSLVLVLGLTVTACGAAAPKPDVAPTAAAAPAAPAAPADVVAPAAAPAAAATAPVAAAAEEATCPVSGEKFKPAADSPRSEYKGTSYVFCCAGCKKKFDANPEKFVTKTGAAAPAAAVAGEVACPVSGEKFVPTAESARSEYKGKSYAFCCPGCKKKFDAAPDKFLAGATKDGKPCAGDCDDKDCDDKATAPKAEDVKPAAKKSKG